MGEAEEFEELWDFVEEKTFLHRFKVREIHRLFSEVIASRLPGDLAECGVYQGGISALMARMLRECGSTKRVHLFDSFEGLPKLDHSKDLSFYAEGMMSFSEESVRRFFDEEELIRYTIFHPGWFEDTLMNLPPGELFCFVHVDCDIYPSTRTCLENLYDRMVPGGIFVFDDYFDFGGGEKKAVDEFVADTGELLFAGPIEQAHFVKGRNRKTEDEPFICHPYHSHDTPVSLEYLFSDPTYLEALKGDSFMNAVPGGGVRGAASLAEATLGSAEATPEEIDLARQAIRVRDYYDKVLKAALEFREEVP